MRSSVAAILRAGFSRAQQVVDPGFDAAASWVLTGSGLGTSSVTGSVLSIISTTNVYFARALTQKQPLEPGSYSITYTILNYSTGSISCAVSPNIDMSSSTDGTTRSANGTFTETLTLTAPGYIGLKGQGAAIIDAMQCNDFTAARVA